MKMRPDLGPAARSSRDTAQYIETMAKEMKQLAARADLGFLDYLLAMVEDDASATVRRLAPGD